MPPGCEARKLVQDKRYKDPELDRQVHWGYTARETVLKGGWARQRAPVWFRPRGGRVGGPGHLAADASANGWPARQEAEEKAMRGITGGAGMLLTGLAGCSALRQEPDVSKKVASDAQPVLPKMADASGGSWQKSSPSGDSAAAKSTASSAMAMAPTTSQPATTTTTGQPTTTTTGQ